jgi:hypothetical protein
MSEVRDREIRALKDLLASEGWAILIERGYRVQWQGEAFCGKIRQVVRPQTNERADSCARELIAGRDAIDGFVGWPEEQIKHLEKKNADELAQDATSEIVRRA